MTMAPPVASDSAAQPSVPRAEKKRRRPALSCEQCRRRKIRCDRQLPCANCIKLEISSCTYAPTHIPASRTTRIGNTHGNDTGLSGPTLVPARSAVVDDHARNGLGQSSPGTTSLRRLVPSPSSGPTAGNSTVDALAARVKELEQKLAATHATDARPQDKLVDEDDEAHDEATAPMKGTTAKIRFFSQGHWMNGHAMFPKILSVLTEAEGRKIGPHRTITKCKTLARTIKAHRNMTLSSDTLGQTVPDKALADVLVDAYFRTFEGALRVLHVPTFRAEYERYWLNPTAAPTVFVIQMQLCMALGASVHDDVFTLRASAMHWIYEAQLWLMLPPEKKGMTIAGIQIMCMLTLAKSACAVGQDLSWVTAGSLVRRAMSMGLHRDPKHLGEMTVYRAEMRRRLWATVLELNLQASFDAGNPPFVSPKHYDSQLPANLNDDQLTDQSDTMASPVNHPDALTDMSAQLLMLRSHPLRLEIIEHVVTFGSKDSYSETLHLSSVLTKACRSLTAALNALIEAQKQAPRSIINEFHCRFVQLMVYRSFVSLHQPMLTHAAEDPLVYYYRKVSLDSSLKIIEVCNLAQPLKTAESSGGGGAAADHPGVAFDRLIGNGSGVFRVVPMQALFSVGMEFIHKKEEERDSLATVRRRASEDLRPIMDAAVELAARRVRAGETTVKIYCTVSAAVALAEGIDRGLSQEQIERAVLESGETSSLRCWELLKEVAERDGVKINEDDGSPAFTEGTSDAMDMSFDWLGDLGWEGMGSDWQWGLQVQKPYADFGPNALPL